MSVKMIKDLLGKTMRKVERREEGADEEMVFSAVTGEVYSFYHAQDWCESVGVEDVEGDLADLEGSPLLVAEEVSSDGAPPPAGEYEPESYTWTFYKFATVKGHVTVRWLGVSNGYYGESVNFKCKNEDDVRRFAALCDLAGMTRDVPGGILGDRLEELGRDADAAFARRYRNP